MRVMVADDSLIVREGLARLLAAAGVEVVGSAADSDSLMRLVASNPPDAAIIDIRMPPSFTHEGVLAAHQLSSSHPELAVLVLSQHLELPYVQHLLAGGAARRGYLLKDRLLHPDQLIGALYRIVAGETVVDPEVVAHALSSPSGNRRLAVLTAREREVLSLIAEGLSDRGISERLYVSPSTVATHVQHIFMKLDLPEANTDNRRVHAVLAHLSP